jgi:hypothetical protein
MILKKQIKINEKNGDNNWKKNRRITLYFGWFNMDFKKKRENRGGGGKNFIVTETS